MSGGRYTGPVCYVPPQGNEIPARFWRTRRISGGWHYSTRVVRGREIPHRRLYLDTTDPDHPFYRYAKRGDLSWDERNPDKNQVMLGALPAGAQHPPEAYDDQDAFVRMSGR